MKVRGFLITLILGIFIFTSAIMAADLQKEIIGKWQLKGKDDWIEFLPDGKLKEGGKIFTYLGTYKFIGKNLVKTKVNLVGKIMEIDATISISGDTMTITDKEQSLIYKKVK